MKLRLKIRLLTLTIQRINNVLGSFTTILTHTLIHCCTHSSQIYQYRINNHFHPRALDTSDCHALHILSGQNILVSLASLYHLWSRHKGLCICLVYLHRPKGAMLFQLNHKSHTVNSKKYVVMLGFNW